MSQQVSVRIDGELCTATEGQTIFEVAVANGRYIPCPLPHGGRELGRLLPAVPGRGRRRSAACCRPARRRSAAACRSPPTRRTLAHHRLMALELLFSERNHSARCASPTGIASCRRWHSARASPMSASPTTIRGCRWTSRIRASCSITTAASSARAACGSATRSKARTCGISPRAASTRCWSPSSIGPGANRSRAPAAASACRSARPARWWRRAGRSRK